MTGTNLKIWSSSTCAQPRSCMQEQAPQQQVWNRQALQQQSNLQQQGLLQCCKSHCQQAVTSVQQPLNPAFKQIDSSSFMIQKHPTRRVSTSGPSHCGLRFATCQHRLFWSFSRATVSDCLYPDKLWQPSPVSKSISPLAVSVT